MAAEEDTGSVSEFDAAALDLSMGGLLLETAVTANLWVDKPLTLTLPGGVGRVAATVRRFLGYADDRHRTTRWGIELAVLTAQQRGLWARFLFSEAHRLGLEAAHAEFLRRQAL